MKYLIIAITLWTVMSCGNVTERTEATSCEYAEYFDVIPGSPSMVVSISPHSHVCDTLKIESPFDNIICMSSSHVACLSAINADSLITAVSGLKYITSARLHERNIPTSARPLYDIGYENSLDYERILALEPDIVVTYSVSGAVPPYIVKLRSLGVPVLILHDHLENHPLARAEYIRLFGAMTGKSYQADSVFACIKENYNMLAEQVASQNFTRCKVLLNVPYADAWYIPGADSYMSRLIRDAGGEVLGAEPEESRSRIISLETAYVLSKEADLWLNVGHCRSRKELASLHPLFPDFAPLASDAPIYNNTLRTNSEGGNDFYESGAARPDLILEDLARILHGTFPQDSLHYFFPLR